MESNDETKQFRYELNPILKTILFGTHDNNSALQILRGYGDVLKIIWQYVCRDLIKRVRDYFNLPNHENDDDDVQERRYLKRVHGSRPGKNLFPAPTGININMMPFIIGDKSSLPREYRHYWNMIELCDVERSRNGKVGYLTIQEAKVEAGQTQRRPGLHTEAAGLVDIGNFVYVNSRWGSSELITEKNGGLYIASNVPKSTRAWNMRVRNTEHMVDTGGDIEYLRFLIKYMHSEEVVLDANAIYWMTDATPHEALPQLKNAYRQFFRLVAGDVTVWYENHSTANRLGTQPKAIIIKGDKFEKKSPD